jgi:hypothetical protein
MEPELRSVLRHCRDFARVRDANGFADCVIQGQIETTMPFNDYWAEGARFLPKPEAQPTSGRKPFPWRSLALIAGAVVVTIVLLAGADALFGPRSWLSAAVKALVGLAAAVLVLALLSGPLLEWFGVKLSLARLLALALAIVGFAMIYLAVQTSVALDGRPQPPPGILNGLISIAAGVGGVGLAVAAVLVAFRAFMMRRGATPFPKAPDSDLPSILKALYLQQRFQDFAITAQGKAILRFIRPSRIFSMSTSLGIQSRRRSPGRFGPEGHVT